MAHNCREMVWTTLPGYPWSGILRGSRHRDLMNRTSQTSAYLPSMVKYPAYVSCVSTTGSYVGRVLDFTGVEMRNKTRTQPIEAYKEGRRSRLKYGFGLTPEDYQQMLVEQNGRCAICKRLPPRGYVLHVDHDHTSGAIRGLLCGECNWGLGHFGDDVVRLQAAIEYLQKAE